jgi:hypothetical protein
MTVGELAATLELDDQLAPKLAKAERKFKDTAKGLDSEAKLGLDDKPMVDGLKRSEKKVRESAKESSDGWNDVVRGARGEFEMTGEQMGGAMALGLTGAIVGGGALAMAALNKTLETGAENANLGISLGLTPELAEEAGRITGEIYAQAFGDSLAEVNDAFASVGKNMGGFGDKSKDEVEDITKGVLVLADAFDQDLMKVTAAAGTMMKTGLAANGMEALDLLTRGLQGPANKSDDLLDTFVEYSTVFRQLGLTGPQALGLMNQALQAGARDSDTVADGLKEFTILAQEAIDPGSNAAAMFYLLGLNGAEMARKIAEGGPSAQEALQLTTDKLAGIEDPAIRGQIAIGLFGTKAEDMQGALGAIDLSSAEAQVGGIEGAMTRATDATSTNQAKVEEWKRSMETNVTNWIAETGIPKLEEWWADWEHGTGMIGRFRDGCAQLGDGLRFLKDEAIDPVVGSLQTLFGWLGDTIEKGEDFYNSGFMQAVLGSGTLGAPMAVVSMLTRDVQSKDAGGLIAGGSRGSPQMILAHAGETVLPTHKMSLGAAMSKVLPGFDGGGVVGQRRFSRFEDGSSSWQVLEADGRWRNDNPGADRYRQDQAAGANFAAMLSNPGDLAVLQALIAGRSNNPPAPTASGSPGPGWIQAWVDPADLERKVGRRAGAFR